MKKTLLISLVTCLATMVLISPVRAQMATRDEALNVAKNWITLIIQNKGDWGGSKTAIVEEIQEFKRGERVIGYFCRVQPKGYIVLSLRKELAPVKMYSATCDLDTESEEGMTDLIKDCMERVLDRIEQQLGPIESVRTQDLQNILEISYCSAWEELESGATILMNYQQGQELLTSSWHQDDPYNRQCPAPPAGDDCIAAHCLVGCGPLASSQIMRYWNWPPYGVGSPYNDTYDWPNMPDTLTGASPLVQINAVAELCHEVGVAASVNYCGDAGCQSGNTLLENMGAFTNNYRYSTLASREERRLYASTAAWFNAIRTQLNVNRPVLYEIPQHFIVVDGWQEIGTPVTQEVHVVYGWGGANDGWYTLDYDIPGTDPTWQWEKMIINIVPAQALGNSLSGTYSLNESFPYRYFDQDTTGTTATFSSGQYLQFLPTITVTGIGGTGQAIRFEGSSSANTQLFTKGDISKGMRIQGGAMKLTNNGSIKFF